MWTITTPVDTWEQEARALWREVYVQNLRENNHAGFAKTAADEALEAFLAAAGRIANPEEQPK